MKKLDPKATANKAKEKKDKLLPPIMKKATAVLNDVTVTKDSEEASDLVKEVEQKLVLDDWAKSIKLIWTSDKQSNAAT